MKEERFVIPKRLEECVKKVMQDGGGRSSAFAICTASLRKKKRSGRGKKR